MSVVAHKECNIQFVVEGVYIDHVTYYVYNWEHPKEYKEFNGRQQCVCTLYMYMYSVFTVVKRKQEA